jgi:hypothetical protein
MTTVVAGRKPAPLSNAPSGVQNSERRRGLQRERGVVLIWACTVCMVVAGVVLTASGRIKAIDEMSRAEFSADGQARQVADAGLVDAYAWFRRQQVQPVASFAPKRNLNATPPINETDDPALGLVRTFEICPGYWGRYTVAPGTPPEPFNDRPPKNGFYDAGENFTDTNGDGRWTPGQGTRDVTALRGLAGNGTVWYVESRAQIFRRPRADLPLGQGPNAQLAIVTKGCEIRRLTLSAPASAAICSATSGGVTVGARARIRSGGACIAYGVLNTLPVLGGGELLGAITSTLVPGWNDSVNAVFGVEWAALRGMADVSTSDPANVVTSPLPDAGLIVVDGDVTFDAARPLRGTAVVAVKGNVTITSGSNSFFNGMLYVDGNLTVRAPALIQGVIVVRGTTNLQGSGGDYVEVEHDPTLISSLMSLMGQYRYSKSPFEPALMDIDGRPNEAKGKKNRNRSSNSGPGNNNGNGNSGPGGGA